MRTGRLAVLACIAALAVAACDRVVDLTVSPDAAHDGARSNDGGASDGAPSDGGASDGGVDGGSIGDALTVG